MMNKKINILLILGLILLNSCEKSSVNIEKEEGKIISLLIDEMAIAFPIPPPPPKDGSKPKPINIDSIKNVRVEIVVDTNMFQTSYKTVIDDEFSKYQKLIDSIPFLAAKSMRKKNINSEKEHNLIFGNSLEDSKSKYAQMISVSRIKFDEDQNVAALFARHSTHPLAGYLNFYLLKKDNGKWKIIFKKNIEVS